jgi:hypothetical protein
MSRVIRSSVSTSIVRMLGPPARSSIECPARLMDRMREGEAQKIRLGVSACLLGREVRYDGTTCAGSPSHTWPIKRISRRIPTS